MRLIGTMVCAAFLCTRAVAAPPGLMDEYAGATQAFMGGLIDNRQWMETYRNHVMSGIDGNWLPLSLLRPETVDDIKKICVASFNHITSTSPYAFTMNRHFNKDLALDYVYTFVVGNTFAEHVDAQKLLDAVGSNNPQIASARLGILSSANGHVGVSRPSENILVFQYPQRAPLIYGRCPH